MENYKVLRAIGKGSFGKVYVVRHIGENKHYVMKVIKMRGIPKAEREACKNEVAIMQRLPHPNIVAYKDSFSVQRGDKLCIVMTYCDGGDLSARLEQQRGKLLPEDQILHWFVQIALGLGCMHSSKVLHRDLKTANIFLLSSGRLVLGDLGISKSLDATMAMASTQIGTPYYMSPELFQSKPYNHKSDVWAIGCVLYELCTMRHPFEAESIQQLGARILRGRYPPIAARYSKGLRSLIDSLLSQAPSSRPDVDEVLRSPFMRKPLLSFVRDMAARAGSGSTAIGVGTMAFGSALKELVADGGSASALGPHSASLFRQIRSLGLGALVTRAIGGGSDLPADDSATARRGPSPAPDRRRAAGPSSSSSSSASAAASDAYGSRSGAPDGSSSASAASGAPASAAKNGFVPAARRAPSGTDDAAKRALRDQQSALRREREVQLSVERALHRYNDEKLQRAQVDSVAPEVEDEEVEEEDDDDDADVVNELGMDPDLEAAAEEDERELALAAAELKAAFEASVRRCDRLQRSIQRLRRKTVDASSDGRDGARDASAASPPPRREAAASPAQAASTPVPAAQRRGSALSGEPPRLASGAGGAAPGQDGRPRMSPGTEALLLPPAEPAAVDDYGYDAEGAAGDSVEFDGGNEWADDWAAEWGDVDEDALAAVEAEDDDHDDVSGAADDRESGYLGRRAAAVRAEVASAVGAAMLDEMLRLERRRLEDPAADADPAMARQTADVQSRLGPARAVMLQRVRELVHVESVLAVA
ncbi:hypothetical protein FNF27_01173 [Cafeteria roenbergensis]|uniref:non-specific serine/threonine protein kinase n=1 Tax=Cafeteria roenbergensis TaxID=33653 RepID=A0A5A8EHQ3_CAFRO|nr:hypothetical protein FNF27_01173 [Cafeteria roenbergensis]